MLLVGHRVHARTPGCSSRTPSSTWPVDPGRLPGARTAPLGRRGGLRPAPEPGLRLPLADGAVLRARRRSSACPAGWCSGSGWRWSWWWPSSASSKLARALGVRSDLACLVAGFAYALSPRHAEHARTDLHRGLAERRRALGAAAAGRWVPGGVAAADGAALAALAVAMVGGVNAAATFAVLPLGVVWLLTREPGPAAAEPDDLVAGVHACSGTLWWLVPLFLHGRLQPAVPRLHRDRVGHDVPDDAVRRAAWHLRLGARTSTDLAGRASQPHHRLSRAEQRRAADVRPGRHDAASATRTGSSSSSPCSWACSWSAGSPGGRRGLVRRRRARSARRGPGAAAQRAQVRPGHPAAAGAGAGLVRARTATGVAVRPRAPARLRGLAGHVHQRVRRARACWRLVGTSLPAVAGRAHPDRPGLRRRPDYWRDAASLAGRQDPEAWPCSLPGSGLRAATCGASPRDEPLQYLARVALGRAQRRPAGAAGQHPDARRRRGATRAGPRLPGPGRVPAACGRALPGGAQRPRALRRRARDPVLVHQASTASPGLLAGRDLRSRRRRRPHSRARRRPLVVDGGWQSRWPGDRGLRGRGRGHRRRPRRSCRSSSVDPEDLLDLQDAGVLDDQPTRLAVDAPTTRRPRPARADRRDAGPGALLRPRARRLLGRAHPRRRPTSGNPVPDYRLRRRRLALADDRPAGRCGPLDGLHVALGLRQSRGAPGRRTCPSRRSTATCHDLGVPAGRRHRRLVAGGDSTSRSTSRRSSSRRGERGGAERVRVVTARGAARTVVLAPGSTTSVAVPAGRPRGSGSRTPAAAVPGLSLAEVTWPGRDITRKLVLPELPRRWGAPDVALLRALRHARSGCAVVDGDTRCVQERVIGSEEPDAMSRVVTLPRPARTTCRCAPCPARASS